MFDVPNPESDVDPEFTETRAQSVTATYIASLRARTAKYNLP